MGQALREVQLCSSALQGGEGASCFPSAVAAATGETPSDILVVKNGAKVQSSKLTVPFWGYPLDPLCRARAVGTH